MRGREQGRVEGGRERRRSAKPDVSDGSSSPIYLFIYFIFIFYINPRNHTFQMGAAHQEEAVAMPAIVTMYDELEKSPSNK